MAKLKAYDYRQKVFLPVSLKDQLASKSANPWRKCMGIEPTHPLIQKVLPKGAR